jgi:hypothetical protein
MTRQVMPANASLAPTDQSFALQSPVVGGGAITIVRDAGGSPCFSGVFVNGAMVAKLSKAQKVRVYLPAGRAVVSAHLVGKGLCGLDLNKRGARATDVIIAKGDELFYRVASDGNGITTVTPIVD